MRSPRARNRKNRLKRQLLTAFLLAISTSGCASSGVPGFSYATKAKQQPVETGGDSVSWDAVLAETSQKIQNTEIQPTGFHEEVVIAAPFADEDNSGNATAVSDSPQDQGSEPEEASSGLAAAADLPATAASVTQQPVDYFVSVALAGHPSIQAARQRVAAATNVIPQVRALPDPMFNNTFWPSHEQSLQTAAGRVGNQMSLSQGIPWPEKLRTRAEIASREVQVAQAELDRIEREIREAVRLAYYEVWFATRAIAIIEESRDLVDDLTKVAEARYRSGGTQQDVLRAQLETDRLDDQIVTLTKQKEVSQADLSALVQQPVSLLPQAMEEIGLMNVPQQLDELIAFAEQCSPELRGLAWEIQRDRERQKLACLEKYPDLQVGLQWGLVSDDHKVLSGVANGHDQISFNVGTTLPIWRDKINAGIREAAHRTSSTTRRLDAERDALYGKLRRLLAQADSLVEQTNIYENRIIPRTEDTLKLAIADYRGERTDFFTLIETYRELLMFETQLARISASLAGTVAQIERAVGCP